MIKAGPGDERGSLGWDVSTCGGKSWSVWSGFRQDLMADCMQNTHRGLTRPCAECYGGAGQYVFNNCKTACLRSWCGPRCLGCADKYKPTFYQCMTGTSEPGDFPQADPAEHHPGENYLGSKKSLLRECGGCLSRA